MSATAETLARLHRLTVDDYYRMAEAGLLAPEERTELIEGAIIDMTPIGSRHAACVDRLTRVLLLAVGQRAVLRVQGPFVLGEHTESQPDLTLLHPREDFYATAHPGPADVLLVVEVADTTVAFDRHTKFPLYARYRLPEAWLVDLPAGVMEIHREPEDGAYTRLDRLGPEDLSAVPLPGLPDTTIDLSGLL